MWDLPGGPVTVGESPSAALARVCRDELGVDVAASAGVAVIEPSQRVQRSVRLISSWHGSPRTAAAKNCTAIRWFAVDQLAELRLADIHYAALLESTLTPGQTIDIRREAEDVWEPVGALHALSRCETYGPLLPGPSMVRFRPTEVTEKWRTRSAKDPSLAVHGGWSGHTLLGFAVTTKVSPQMFELNALHVRADWHGRGLADRLHRAVLDSVTAQNGFRLRLWVVENNLRARRFYEKHGWRPTGRRRELTVSGAALTAVSYLRSVGHGPERRERTRPTATQNQTTGLMEPDIDEAAPSMGSQRAVANKGQVASRAAPPACRSSRTTRFTAPPHSSALVNNLTAQQTPGRGAHA